MDKVIEKKHKWLNKKTIWFTVGGIIILLVAYNIFFGDKSSKLNVEKEKSRLSQLSKMNLKITLLLLELLNLLARFILMPLKVGV